MSESLQLCVELFHLLLLLATAASFEHAAIDDLDFLQRMKLLRDVLQYFAGKSDQLSCVRLVHGKGSGKDMEPHAVDDFCHVSGPLGLVHSLNLLLRLHLLVDTP